MLGGDTSGVVGQLIGGWQINGIVYANTGYPLDYKVARDTLGTFYTNARGPARPWMASDSDHDRPVRRRQRPGGRPDRRQFRVRHGRPSTCTTRPATTTAASSAAPATSNVDFSLFKEFKMPWFTSEGSKLQLRLEAFNLFNHTNYTMPSITLRSARLGVTSSANANRQIQLGAKFIF